MPYCYVFSNQKLISYYIQTIKTTTKGGFMSYFSKWFGSKERRILILGLDGAGIVFLFFNVSTKITHNYRTISGLIRVNSLAQPHQP